jgi:hypothetical protein
MKNKKIIIIAASLVLAAALALCGCMYLIGEPNEETQQYDSNDMSGPSVVEETPTAQSEFQKKFGVFGKEATGINGEKMFYLFTKEQVDESLKMRKEGVRRSLTYDGIIFIINDTIRLYFEYDQIVLTDFTDHTVGEQKSVYHKLSSSTESFEPYKNLYYESGTNNSYTVCTEKEDYRFITIDTYHGDLSEFGSYDDAIVQYSTMLMDIERMIAERLRILDTGTLCYCNSDLGRARNTHLYGILLDSGVNADHSQYVDSFEAYVGERRSNNSDKAIVGIRNYDKGALYQSTHILCYGNKQTEVLFPTAELEEMEPKGSIVLSGSNKTKLDEVQTESVHIKFDVHAKTVDFLHVVNKHELGSQKYGTYRIEAGKLILDFYDGTQLTIEYVDGKYVFAEQYYKDGEWIKFDAKIKMREGIPVTGNTAVDTRRIIIFPNSFK